MLKAEIAGDLAAALAESYVSIEKIVGGFLKPIGFGWVHDLHDGIC